jgi:hypothetical protein
MDDLKILVGTGAFDSEKHCGCLALQSKATDLVFKQYKTIYFFAFLDTTF